MKGRHGALRKLYLLRPRLNSDIAKLAEQLLSLKPVEEVLLTEGDCGLIVKARFTNGNEPTEVTDYITRNIGSRFGKVVSYYSYRK